MRGFKVFWVKGNRKVERTFAICGQDLVISTKLEDDGSTLEIVRIEPTPVWNFKKVVGKKNDFGFSSTNGRCRRRSGIYLDGEKVNGEILTKNFLKSFLDGGEVLIVSIDKWISIIEFPGGRVKRIPMDDIMILSLDVLGKDEFLEILREVIG